LNLGVSGLVKDQESQNILISNARIGDIVTLTVAEDFDSEEHDEYGRSLIALTYSKQACFHQILLDSLTN
jgi:hypothetical protein